MDKKEKIKMVVECYLNSPSKTIDDVSNETGISKSSIQRYLNDPSVGDILVPEVFAELEAKRLKNRVEGRRKGGINSFLNNVPLKDEHGQFIGSKKYDGDKDRLKEKYKTILILYKIIFTKNCNSLDELTSCYNAQLQDSERVTRDYVYDCLTSGYLNEVFDEQMRGDIQNWLNNNREFGNKKGANVVNSRKI